MPAPPVAHNAKTRCIQHTDVSYQPFLPRFSVCLLLQVLFAAVQCHSDECLALLCHRSRLISAWSGVLNQSRYKASIMHLTKLIVTFVSKPISRAHLVQEVLQVEFPGLHGQDELGVPLEVVGAQHPEPLAGPPQLLWPPCPSTRKQSGDLGQHMVF